LVEEGLAFMPIYEYLCPACRRIFSFLSASSQPKQLPACPRCGGTKLRKQVSRFAVGGGTRKAETGKAEASGGADAAAPPDDPRLEQEMERLMSDADGIDENDPRQLGCLMRRMGNLTGERFDPGMESAIRRLEAGEDPEKIEADMGEVLGAAGDEGGGPNGGAPSRDGGLYPM
jgi:putative FmdB family regulatory protein